MLEKAIAKIKAEMDSNKANSYIQVVGDFLLQHLEINHSDAEKIVQEGKTIKNSLEEMKKLAKAKAVEGCGMFAPQEGFEIVLKYFGIERDAPVIAPSPAVDSNVHEVQEKKPSIDFNVGLDF